MKPGKCKCAIEWCGRTANASGNGLCRRHYDQMRNHGFLSDRRTVRDPSRVFVVNNVAHIMITDRRDEIHEATAIVDVEDVEKISSHRWTLNSNGYVRTFIDGCSPTYLHRLVLGYYGTLDVDHINRNKLDNRKSNLRIVEHFVNTCNCETNPHIVSRSSRPYGAKFNYNGKTRYLGSFEKREDAMAAIYEAKRELGVFV